jgi:hypothetical protein
VSGSRGGEVAAAAPAQPSNAGGAPAVKTATYRVAVGVKPAGIRW